MYLLMIMALFIPLVFMFLSHPVSLSIMIFTQVIITALLCGSMINTFWFSYMLFLVMIGGLMVLFLYMTNVAPNEKFKPSKFVKMLSILFLCLIPPSLTMDKFYTFTINYFKIKDYSISLETILMKFYNFPSMNILFMIMIFLLMTMIMAVKMTDIKKGALRQKY